MGNDAVAVVAGTRKLVGSVAVAAIVVAVVGYRMQMLVPVLVPGLVHSCWCRLGTLFVFGCSLPMIF